MRYASWMLCLLSAGCRETAAPAIDPSFKLAVTGSSKCLGLLFRNLMERDVGLARAPVWTDDTGNMGIMEVGPIPGSRIGEVLAYVRTRECVQKVEQRPHTRDPPPWV